MKLVFILYIILHTITKTFAVDGVVQVIRPMNNFTIIEAEPGDGKVSLSWNKLEGVSEYLINYDRKARGLTQSVRVSNSPFTIVGLENGVTYTFVVISILQTGRQQQTMPISVALPQRSGLQPHQLGLLINDNDPDSVALGEYYRLKRHIPNENIVHVRLPKVVKLALADFESLKTQVDSSLSDKVQAIAIAWTNPSRVECNSITSALALGYMTNPCVFNTCSWGKSSPYFNASSTAPFNDYKMRPAMMIAAANLDEAKQLVDRGVASDGTNPSGTAYIMNTSDKTRSLRARIFPSQNLGKALSPYVNVEIKNDESISDTKDALFYFQGLAVVNHINQNKYLPGAVADHLTSYGGMLTDSSQMSAINFISGGLTGTFGTVSEPCAYAEKFPNPSIMISHYTKGETLIEAYWKSVLQTFQGLFVGEPLANPWKQVLPTN